MIKKMSENKIKILFDAQHLNCFFSKSSSRSGIFWVALNLAEALCKHKDVKVYFISDNPDLTKKLISTFRNRIPEAEAFYGDIREMDIFFSPMYKIPKKIKQTGIPCFTILYDTIPLVLSQYYNYVQWYDRLITSLTESDYGFTISEYTKKDFLKYLPQLDEKKLTTIPLSTNQPYKPNQDKKKLAEVLQKYHIPQETKYLFSLCSLEPRKNLIRSVKTFIEFIKKNKVEDLVYVLGGGAWDGFIERFEKEVPEYAYYKDKIIRIGYVDDEDMEILYSNAEWFVYTSQYEGFGMPPLEAMSCGCPVITSNNSSLPEVVGDAGQMIDWDSDEQHIKAYEKYYFDEKFKDKMAKKGLERSKQFSWDKAADIMVETFKNCPKPHTRKSLNLEKFYASINIRQTSIRLFNFIPLLKIRKNTDKMKTLLFGFLPIFGKKQQGGKTVWKILEFPVFKIRRMSNGITTKYYILGIPILKISKK